MSLTVMTTPCLVIPHESADGPGNMALDEALLEEVAQDPSHAAFRTYEWSVPTLSLGYFQKISDAESEPRWRSVPIVRRPTGGGAIWHHHEVTYAVVLPLAHPLARRGGTLYHAVHTAIAQVLQSKGIAAQARGAGASSGIADRPFLCFADRDPEDLVAHGFKIVGSAQRRRAGAVLQHGSVLLARSSVTPELPGAGDLSDVTIDASTWSDLLRDHLPKALDLSPVPSEVGSATRDLAHVLEESVYRNPTWTRRR